MALLVARGVAAGARMGKTPATVLLVNGMTTKAKAVQPRPTFAEPTDPATPVEPMSDSKILRTILMQSDKLTEEDFHRLASTTSARIGSTFKDKELFLQAVTHRSFLNGKLPCNDRLALFGNALLLARATETVYVTFPKLPTEAVANAVEAYTSNYSLAKWARSVGLNDVVRWKPNLSSDPAEKDNDNLKKAGETKILASAVCAIIAAHYHDKGMAGASAFIDKHFLSRQIDIQETLVLKNPKRLLTALMVRQNKPKPVSRILAETGRLSNYAMFRVGVFSGETMLAEASAQSIKLATTLAAKRALQENYLDELQKFPVVDPEGNVAYLSVADTAPLNR